MQWLSPCTSCKLQAGFKAGSPRKFLDFNSLKSHFLGLQVIIKDRILVRFQLGNYSKYIYHEKSDQFLVKTCVDFPLRWCLRNGCKNFYTYYQWLLFSFETVFITCLHPITLCTLLPSLWSRLRERPTFCNTTPGFLARWCLRNELKNFYSVNMSLQIQVVLWLDEPNFQPLRIHYPDLGKCCVISVEFLHLFSQCLISRGNRGFHLKISAVFSSYPVCKISY